MVKKKSQNTNHDSAHSTSPKPSTSSDTITLNYWMIASIVLAILVVVSFFVGGNPSISAETAGQKVVDFASQQGATASVVSVEEEGSLYKVTVSIEGQEVPVYVTNDGEKLVPSVIELTPSSDTNTNTNTDNPAPTNIPKSDKPVIELFVMSHCPYGTQVEKGILPVVKTLEDKIDFEVKFVYYAMHGEIEVYEQLNQYCIQEEQNDKFLPYLTCFLEDGNGERCLAATGINMQALETCTTAADKEFSVTANFENKATWLSGRFPLFDTSKEDNAKYDVGGSPTLIINGVEAQVGRDSQSLLNAVCGAFNVAPEECSTTFQAGTPAPGFGFGTVETSNNVAAGCGY